MRVFQLFRDPRLFVAIAFLAILIPEFPQSVARRLNQDSVLTTADRQDYLASLHNASYPGCMMLERYKPKTVFVGDSHAYAAIDFLEADRLLGTGTVGQCAMAGAYLPSYLMFLDWMAQSPYRPERIVLITSLRQFTRSGDTSKRLEQHRALLFDKELEGRTMSKWLDAAADGKPPFGRSASAEIAARERQLAEMDDTDEAAISELIRTANPPHLAKWRAEVPDWKIAPRIDREIQALCGKVRQLGIELTIVHTPESPLAEEIYSNTQRRNYADLLSQFDCAARVEILSSQKLGLGNRHFLNRMAKADYDYTLANVTGDNSETDEREWYSVFDLDHPNRAAAFKVTQRIVDVLRNRPTDLSLPAKAD